MAAIRSALRNLCGLEAEAVSVHDYVPGSVPGLVQTAMLQAEVTPFSTQELERRLQAGLTRQALLAQGDAPQYHAVIDEVALHRRVGGPEVMRAQLQRIGQSAQLPNVTAQVIPSEAGAHPAIEKRFLYPRLRAGPSCQTLSMPRALSATST